MGQCLGRIAGSRFPCKAFRLLRGLFSNGGIGMTTVYIVLRLRHIGKFLRGKTGLSRRETAPGVG
ncbi:MAG: hypothetical protein LBN21_13095, partial [Treponema sp.]|nr:hypothetical protein [Treponema sp.]